MPAEFNKLGVSFLYPDNWTLDDKDARAGRDSVTVYSPGGAFWSISIHRPSVDPADLAETVVKAMKAEYEDLEAEQARETIEDIELTGYNLSFYCLDLTNTASIRCLRTHRATYAIFWQVEDREFEQVGNVFLAITISLLGNLDQFG